MVPGSTHVIVTGGAGFIGSNLVKRLVREGAHVTVIDNLWRGSIANLLLPDGRYCIDLETDFHQEDLTDHQVCLSLLRNADIVYHLADIVAGVDFAFREESFIFRQNLLINTNVLDACVTNGIPDYVYIGTACSFPKHLQMKEGISALVEDQTYPAQPESSYGWSKLMGEYEAELVRKSGGMNIGILRLHNVYGPNVCFNRERSQAIPALIRKAVMYPREPFVVWGSGEQYRDFVYVDDVVDALLLVSQKGMNRSVIQIGSEKATSLREVARMIIDISGKPIEMAFDETMPQGDRGRVAVCDRARRILGWSSTTDFRTGLERTYEWICDRIDAGGGPSEESDA